jgi:hypothetical protein
MRGSALKRWLAVVPLFLTACATIGPPLPPSLDLPQPPSDLRASRKGDRVTLTWTFPNVTTDRQTIRTLGPTRICRGMGTLKECGTPVGRTAGPVKMPANNSQQKPEGSYTDVIPVSMETDSPDAIVTYAVEVLNPEGRGAGVSNQVRIPLAHSLPPPQDFQAKLTHEGVLLSWSVITPPRSQQEGARYVFRVYRTREGSTERVLAGQALAGTEPGYLLTDSNIEWEKTYEYRAEIVTLIDIPNKAPIQVEGDDTPTVKVFADDVFPPAVPTGLQAVFSGPGQKAFIDLVWAPVTDADLAGYNIYRSEGGGPAIKLNVELVRAPAYRDANVQAGKHYSYSVSSVDQRGNESGRSEEASEAVP